MAQIEDTFHLGVKALIRNPAGKVLLLEREHRTKGMYWDIPGGRLHKGESLLETLKRELEEETGLKDIEDVVPFMTIVTDIRIHVQGSDIGLILSIYRLDLGSSFTPRLSDEHTNFEWFTLLQAAELLKKQYPREFIKSLETL
jgi:8-oxo-dGTP pyrophosphatase MutT (NUDIX family)